MTQEEKLYYEIERRGNRITTFELMTLGISQYQARLKGLREKLAPRGLMLTMGEPVLNQKKCYIYRIYPIKPEQLDLINP